MSETNWSRFRGKRLNFSFFSGAGGKMEYVVAGVLGVVILIAAYLIYNSLSGPSMGSGPKTVWFRCEKCNKEHEVNVKDLAQAQNLGDELEMMKRDCPFCGGKKTCWREIECPNCHQRFIGDSEKAHYEAMRTGRGEPPNVRDVCPYCHTDVNKWYIEHAKK